MKGTLLKDFGGRDRHLRYNMNAWGDIGDRLGVKVRMGHFQQDLLEVALPISAVRTVIWGGLLHEETALEERTVGEWIDEDNIAEVLEAFFSRFAGTSSPEVQSAIQRVMGSPDEALPSTTSPEEAAALAVETGAAVG